MMSLELETKKRTMKRNLRIFEVIFFVAIIMPFDGNAQNPIIQNIYTADPAPLVFKDRLYLYTGHDEDNAPDDRFVMRNYHCFSTTDMVNWTHHGNVLHADSVFKWSGGDANAAQCIYRNGKFYYYISVHDKTHPGVALGVAVSDSPLGPFKDAIGHALVTNDMTTYARHSWDDLDPTVFIDDDGQAYLYWGNNALYCVKLNEDMISYSGDIIIFDIKDTAAFGPDFEEAPWLFKRNGTYYLFYAAHIPEAIYYATSSSPLGPWKYGGVVMEAMAQGCMSNHPGVIQYKGNWYLFYQNQDLPNGIDKRRCINVQPFEFNPDGTISKIPHTKEGVINGVANLNPYQRTEAETMSWAEGIETDLDNKTGVYVTDIDNGDYIKVRSIDFGKGAKSFEASVASASGGSIEIRFDSITGTLLGTCIVKNTGSWQSWAVQSCTVNEVKGIHDVYFVFKGGEGDLFNFDWWKFNAK